MASSTLRIIVTGLIAQHPLLGGVTWDYLQYVVGLDWIGHDVYYFEDSGQYPYNLDGGKSGEDWVVYDPTLNVTYLNRVLSRYNLGDKWAYRFPIKSEWYGLPAEKRDEIINSADLLINVSGTLETPENYRQIPRLVYIDSDPVFTQIKLKLPAGQEDFQRRAACHDVFFSFGECLPAKVPITNYDWRPTRQPIVLSEWAQPSLTKFRDVYTTVMSWTSYKPLTYGNQTYGQKDIEFKRFIELPKLVDTVKLEVALGKVQHGNWETRDKNLSPAMQELIRSRPQISPSELLTETGWQIVDATEKLNDLDSYRDYILSSKAEWSVAKNAYVLGQTGWFSCRSACYLASGKPVVVQDTGFSSVLPVGDGILPFRNLEEATSAIRQIEKNYNHHSKAALDIARQYFDSDKILTSLVDEAINAKISVRKRRSKV
jgi:hypothetical protein